MLSSTVGAAVSVCYAVLFNASGPRWKLTSAKAIVTTVGSTGSNFVSAAWDVCGLHVTSLPAQCIGPVSADWLYLTRWIKEDH